MEVKPAEERVAKLERVAWWSKFFAPKEIFWESMYAPLQHFEGMPGGHEGIVEEQLQQTRERLGKKKGEPLVACDLGCAYGVMVAQLNQMEGVEAFGVDQLLYPPATDNDDLMNNTYGLAPEMFRGGRHVVADITDMKGFIRGVPTNSFDFLVSSATLIHLPEFFLLGAIAEIDRVLVPGGGVLLHVSGSITQPVAQKEYFKAIGKLGKRDVEVVGGDGFRSQIAEIIHFEYK